MSEQNTVTEFTSQQISDWRAFERVRSSGEFNMFDPRARAHAGLDRDSYAFTMRNYSQLKLQDQAED